MHQTRSIAYTPEAPTVLITDTQAPLKATAKAGLPRSFRYRASTRTMRARRDPCAQAKERREATLERVGLKRNYDLLSKLDADVRRVCR